MAAGWINTLSSRAMAIGALIICAIAVGFGFFAQQSDQGRFFSIPSSAVSPSYQVRFALPQGSAENGNGGAIAQTASSVASPALMGPSIVAPSTRIMPGRESSKGVLPLKFDIRDVGTASNTRIEGMVASMKMVRFRSEPAGSINVAIGDDASLYVDKIAIARIVSGDEGLASSIASEPAGMISLARLRELGFSVQYDPIADALEISSKS